MAKPPIPTINQATLKRLNDIALLSDTDFWALPTATQHWFKRMAETAYTHAIAPEAAPLPKEITVEIRGAAKTGKTIIAAIIHEALSAHGVPVIVQNKDGDFGGRAAMPRAIRVKLLSSCVVTINEVTTVTLTNVRFSPES